MGLEDLYKNRTVLTDDYNLGHWLMKCNANWETSHIYNRNRSMILFGFWENVIHTLNTQITDKMIGDADKCLVLKSRILFVFANYLFPCGIVLTSWNI